MNPDVFAVVARFREDVAWLEGLGLAHAVYDKNPAPLAGAVPLPNVGREAHTYLTHILKAYPNFHAYTAFLQGDPFAHMEAGAGVRELRAAVEAAVAKKRPFTGFSWFRLVCDRLGRPHQMRDPDKKGKWAGYGRDIPVGEVYAALFDGPVPERFVAGAATGNFMVARDRILARPRVFYARALELVLADPDDARNTGHALERLWQIVFNGNTCLNKAEYGPAGV